MKKFSILCLVVGMMLVLSFTGCKKAEQSAETPKPAAQLQAPAIVMGFEVSNGTLEKGGIGYVLSSEQDKAAVAMKKLETPFSNSVTIKFQIKSALPSGTRNGYVAFAENPKQLSKAGVLIGGMKYVIEGPFVEQVIKSQKLDQNKVFDVELTVDLKAKAVVLRVDGTEVKTKMTKAPASISYVGYVAGNTKTEFSDLQISGN